MASEQNPVLYFVDCYRKYADFQGRARRKEFWYYELFSTLLFIILSLTDSAIGWGRVLYGLFALINIIPGIAASTRRLHDTGRSGWWFLVPIANIVFWVQEGERYSNKYGANPITGELGLLPGVAPHGVSSMTASSLDKLEKLAALRDKGILTEEEFQAQKMQIL